MWYTLISAALIAAVTFASASPMPQGGQFASQSVPLAIAKNKSFNGLSESSTCDAATQPDACINKQFAQCSGGKFVASPCSGGLQCFALPLVNSVGTSVTCDTPENAATRMGFSSVAELNSAIGGGATAASAAATPATPATTPAATTIAAATAAANTTTPPTSATSATSAIAAAPTPSAAAPAGSIASQSIPLAIAKNASFKTLTVDSPCDAATQPTACINGEFAQCSGGKFAVSPCSNGLQCFALPLVNSVGTSVTCDTPQDAARRMGQM